MSNYFQRQSPWATMGAIAQDTGNNLVRGLADLRRIRSESRETAARVELYGAQTANYRVKTAGEEAQQEDMKASTTDFAQSANDVLTASQAQNMPGVNEASGRMVKSLARMSQYYPQLVKNIQDVMHASVAGGFSSKAMAASLAGANATPPGYSMPQADESGKGIKFNQAPGATATGSASARTRGQYQVALERYRAATKSADAKLGTSFNKEEHAKDLEAANKRLDADIKAIDALGSPGEGNLGERVLPGSEDMLLRNDAPPGPSGRVKPLNDMSPSVTAPTLREDLSVPGEEEWRTLRSGTKVRVRRQPVSDETKGVPSGFGDAITRAIPVDAAAPRPGELDLRLRTTAVEPIMQAYEQETGKPAENITKAAEWAFQKGYITEKEFRELLK